MEEKDLKEALDQRDKALEQAMDEKIKSIPAPADNTEKLKELEKAQDEMQKSIEGLNETNKSISEQLGKITAKEVEAQERKKGYVAAIREAIIEKAKDILSFNQTSQMQITKAVGTVTTGNITDAHLVNAEMENGVTGPQRRLPYLRQLISVSGIGKGNAVWMERVEGEGGAAPTAENAAKSQADQDWVEKTSKVEKITAYTKVSEEMLEDIDFAATDIALDLTEQVMLKEDEQIYKGNGTSPNLKGLTEYATTFSVTASANNPEFYHAISNPTEMDVLRVAAAIIAKANFVPTHVLLHPSDAAKIDLLKSSTGAYVNKTINDLMKNITIVENTGVTAGTFLIGDMSKSNYRVRRDITVVVGRDADDLTKNLYTFVAEIRGTHYVKSNHTPAFVKGTFSTCITSIAGDAISQNVAITSPLNQAGTAVQTDELTQ